MSGNYLSRVLVREAVAEVQLMNPKLTAEAIKEIIKQNAMAIREDQGKALSELKKFLTDSKQASELLSAAKQILERLYNVHGFRYNDEAQRVILKLERDLGLTK